MTSAGPFGWACMDNELRGFLIQFHISLYLLEYSKISTNKKTEWTRCGRNNKGALPGLRINRPPVQEIVSEMSQE
jgi:hypothetical protein